MGGSGKLSKDGRSKPNAGGPKGGRGRGSGVRVFAGGGTAHSRTSSTAGKANPSRSPDSSAGAGGGGPPGHGANSALELAGERGWDPKPASTRDRLVETARQLFLARGYHATGIAEILREAGVNSGSLYYFFKTKEDLLLAVLDQYVEMLHPCVIDPVFSRVGDPIDRIFAVLDGYRQMLQMTECRQGCPIGNLALEMSEISEAVRERIATNFTNWRKAIQQCLTDAGERVPSSTDADKLSSFILTVMEGAVMQARAYKSLDPFDASVAMLRDYFDRIMDAGPG